MARALPRPLRVRGLEPDLGAVVPARRSRLANGVYNGVAGVVEACASALARTARLDGEVR